MVDVIRGAATLILLDAEVACVGSTAKSEESKDSHLPAYEGPAFEM